MRSIGAHAFDSCAYINAFYCNTFHLQYVMTSFLYVNQKEARLYVPEHSVEAYSCAKGWMNLPQTYRSPSNSNMTKEAGYDYIQPLSFKHF